MTQTEAVALLALAIATQAQQGVNLNMTRGKLTNLYVSDWMFSDLSYYTSRLVSLTPQEIFLIRWESSILTQQEC